MKYASTLVVLAACGAAPEPKRAPPPIVTIKPVEEPVVAHPAALISRPDSAIEIVAVTLDGTAAVTIGESGDSRLWPALDGTLEPRVLDLPTTSAVAIATDARGIAIAAIDSAGGLALRVVDRAGVVLSRTTLDPDAAFTDVITTARGFLVTRADESLAFVTADGVLGTPLVAESSQHIAALAASSTDVALVQVDSDTGRGLRWLKLSPSLAWGDWVPTKVSPEGVIALSPSAAQIGLVVGEERFRTTVILDATSGAATMVNEQGSSQLEDIVIPTETDVFVGDTSAARVRPQEITNKPQPLTRKSEPTRHQIRRIAAARGRVFTGMQLSIMIDDPTERTWLGYDMTDVDEIVSAQDRVMIRTRDEMVELGRDLTESAHLASENLTGMEYAGGTQWLVETVDQVRGIGTIRLVDTKSDADTTVLSASGATGHFLFDPASRLLSISGPHGALGRVDQDGTFQRLAELKTRGGEIFIAPLDKSRANGVSAIAVTNDVGERIRWVTDPSDLTTGATTQLFDANVAAYDEVGNVYAVTRVGAHYGVAVYKDGKLVNQHDADDLGAQVYPRGDGVRIGRNTMEGFTITDAQSRVLWSVQQGGFARIAFLADGTLIAGGASGIARYNADTGERLGLRCGLSFGVHREAPARSSNVPAMCSAP